jgi:hypothetical protein
MLIRFDVISQAPDAIGNYGSDPAFASLRRAV